MTIPDPRAAQAYKLYIDDGLAMDTVKSLLHVDRRRIRRWIVERGGEIRPHGYNGDRAGQVGPGKTEWLKHVRCTSGPVHENREAVGAMFCAAVCSETYYEGKCDEEPSVQDLAAFEEFKAERAADAKLIAERKKKKLSGGALWRGVRGNVKWR